LIQPTNEDDRRAMVVRDGRLVPIPEGFRLLAPTRLIPFLLTPVLSPLGKLRIGLDLFLPRRRESGDETLAGFVGRRLGREALERMAQPLVGGIYGGDPERLSLQATMPRFLDMEYSHGSVIRGLLAGMRGSRRGGNRAATRAGPRYGLFVSLEGGLQTLVERLVEALPPGGLHTGLAVERIEPEPGGWRLCSPGFTERFDAVALAMPGWAAARLSAFDPILAKRLASIRYSSSAAVNLVFQRRQIPGRLNSFGFVVPRIENRVLLACTYASVKYAGRAPEGQVILRAFSGGAGREGEVDRPPEELLEDILGDLRDLMGIRGTPLKVWSLRHERVMPQYELGHLDLIAEIQDRASRHPGLFLAGNGFRGIGIPDCVAQARQAGVRAAEYLDSLARDQGKTGSPEFAPSHGPSPS
jgi:oxygen-dependent protoporphyrinogen oxidase